VRRFTLSLRAKRSCDQPRFNRDLRTINPISAGMLARGNRRFSPDDIAQHYHRKKHVTSFHARSSTVLQCKHDHAALQFLVSDNEDGYLRRAGNNSAHTTPRCILDIDPSDGETTPRSERPMSALLSGEDAAALIGISSKTLGKLRREGQIPYFAVTDHRFFYRPDDCEAYLASRRRFADIIEPKPVRRTRTASATALPRFTERCT